MKFCIDAGHNHSGKDTGAVGALYKEQDLTFLIANKLKEYLEGAEHSVIMTRNTIDANVNNTSLEKSLTQRAEISNRNNCDYFISVHINAGGGIGVETYVFREGSKAYEKAILVQKALTNLGRVDRGVKVSNFAVLRKTNAPALLVECGFIDNENEEKWIMANIDKIAMAIATAFGVSEKVEEKEEIKEMENMENISPAEAIAILSKKGIISEDDKWYGGTWNEQDVKWLLVKTGMYLKNL